MKVDPKEADLDFLLKLRRESRRSASELASVHKTFKKRWDEEERIEKERERRAKALLRSGLAYPVRGGFRCAICGRTYSSTDFVAHDPRGDVVDLVHLAKRIIRARELDRALDEKFDTDTYIVEVGKSHLPAYMALVARALGYHHKVVVQGRGPKLRFLYLALSVLGAKEVEPGVWTLSLPPDPWGIEVVRK